MVSLRVVSHWQSHLVEKDIVHTNASSSFNLLFSSFFVFVTHMHDSCSRGAVVFVTVHAFVILADLVGHAAVLAHTNTNLVGFVLHWFLRAIFSTLLI